MTIDPDAPEPSDATSDSQATSDGFPPGFLRDATRPEVFDPALRHHGAAFIRGEPVFSQPESAEAYYRARGSLLDAALRAVARSPARDQYVLRGSVCLAAWFGPRARRPKDVDIVVRPPDIAPGDPRGLELLGALRGDIARELRAIDAPLVEERIVTDSIWTYERAEGRRLLFPWRRTSTVDDNLQIDVVYREPMMTEPERHEMDGGQVWFASRPEQLAWKILWLFTDSNAQGKDLYDAVLLAEGTPLSRRLLRGVFDGKGERWDAALDDASFARALPVEWNHFALDYPDLAIGSVDLWRERLADTLQLVE